MCKKITACILAIALSILVVFTASAMEEPKTINDLCENEKTVLAIKSMTMKDKLKLDVNLTNEKIEALLSQMEGLEGSTLEAKQKELFEETSRACNNMITGLQLKNTEISKTEPKFTCELSYYEIFGIASFTNFKSVSLVEEGYVAPQNNQALLYDKYNELYYSKCSRYLVDAMAIEFFEYNDCIVFYMEGGIRSCMIVEKVIDGYHITSPDIAPIDALGIFVYDKKNDKLHTLQEAVDASLFKMDEVAELFPKGRVKKVLMGDANADGKVNMDDVVFVQKFIVGLDFGLSHTGLIQMDMDGDDDVRMKDVVAIQKLIAGLN